MAVIMTSSGPMTVRSQPSFTTRRRSSGGGSSGGGSTTRSNPTPSAGELTGTASEKEAQIAAFRSGGQTALAAERAKAESRIAQEQQAKQDAIRKEVLRLQQIEQDKQVRRDLIKQQNRTNAIKKRLQQQHAFQQTRILTDRATGDKIKQETLINQRTGERVFTSTNLRTGAIKTRTFEKQDGKGRVRKSGEILQEFSSIADQEKEFQKLVDAARKNLTPTERTFMQKVNYFALKLIGKTTTYNLLKTGASYKKNTAPQGIAMLNKDRDKIYAEINKLNTRFTGSLSHGFKKPEHLENYQNQLAVLVARYNKYNEAKKKAVDKLPDKKVKATLEFNPALGKTVLVADAKDTSVSKRIDAAIRNATAKIQRGKGVVGATAVLSALVLGQMASNAIEGYKQLPSSIKMVIQNPSVIKQIPAALAESGKAMGRLINLSPTVGLVKIGAEVYFWTRGSSDAIRLIKKVQVHSSKLRKTFKAVKTDSLGVKSIKNVNKVGDIEIVLNRGQKLKTNPLKVINEAKIKVRLKKTPTLAPLSKVEKKFLKAVKKRGDVVTGSYAREVLLKKKFTRKHVDLDIASKNIPALQKELVRIFKKDVTFKVKPNSVLVKVKGKEIADLVKFSKAEAGLIKKFGTVKVAGLKLAHPKAIIGGKSAKLGSLAITKGSIPARTKTLRDLEKLTGKKALSRPSLTGAYGFSKKDMKKYLGKSGPLTTAQADLLTTSLFKRNPTLKNKKWLYASPWEIKTGKAQVRVSRLALGKEQATIMDLLKGKASLFNKNKPQIFVLPKEKIFRKSKTLTKGKIIKTPQGFVVPNFSSELEVILGDGWILKRGKILGRTIIGGESIPIVELVKVRIPKSIMKEIGSWRQLNSKLNTATKSVVKKARLKKLKAVDKITQAKLIKKIHVKEKLLNSKMKKLTGFEYFSEPIRMRKVFPLQKKLLSGISKASRVRFGTSKRLSPIRTRRKSPKSHTRISKKTSRKTSRKTSKRKSPKRTARKAPRSKPSKSPRKAVRTRRPQKRSPRRTPRGITKPIKPTPTIKILLPKGFKKKTISRTQPVFYVKIKRRGRIVNLTPRPLILSDAKDFLAHRVDNGLSRSGWFEPIGRTRKVVGLPKPMRGYFRKVSRKLRPYKVRVGKKRAIRNGYIEKSKYISDTKREVRQLKNARIKAKRRAIKRKRKIIVKRKLKRSPSKKKRIIRRKPIKKRMITKKKRVVRRPRTRRKNRR